MQRPLGIQNPHLQSNAGTLGIPNARPPSIPMKPMPNPLAYLWNLCQTPRHTYETYANPLAYLKNLCQNPRYSFMPMESMPDSPAYPWNLCQTLRHIRCRTAWHSKIPRVKLCQIPRYTYGTCARPLVIPMEPMPHPLAFPMSDTRHSNRSNARPCSIQTKLMQTTWHSTKF